MTKINNENSTTLQFPNIYQMFKTSKLNHVIKLEHLRFNKKIILAHKNKSSKYSAQKFEGVCIDTGAVEGVCGIDQVRAHFEESLQPFTLPPSRSPFRLCDIIL